MDVGEIPVDERTHSAAHWALLGLVALPTVMAIVVGAVMKLTGHGEDYALRGLIGWIVDIAVLQFAILLVARSRYVSGVSFRVQEPPRPPQNDPGIFHHE